MYAKIFTQIYDGTLCTNGSWQALVTFQQFLVLSDIDGNVDMTPKAISRRTTIPLEIIEKGINELMQPDPESRTPTAEGKRLIPLSEDRSWGWKIVNYKQYSKLRSESERREYHREYWHKRKNSTKNVESQQHSTKLNPSTPITINTDIDVDVKELSFTNVKDCDLPKKKRPKKTDNCPYSEIERLYSEILPELTQVYSWTDKRKIQIRKLWEVKGELPSLEDWGRYFKFIRGSPFLMGDIPATNGRKRFVASLEWITNPTNYIKITEGNYHVE